MKYRSTRSSETVTALEALVKGLASDGGLYVPSELPAPFLAADDLMCIFPTKSWRLMCCPISSPISRKRI